jgi:hypothetical protein
MPRISRNKDRCRTGHLCSTTAPVNASQFTVFANDKAILIRGDRVGRHTILIPTDPPRCVGHRAKLTGSSRTVFVRNIGVGRKGDRADFGAMIGASFNVFAG